MAKAKDDVEFIDELPEDGRMRYPVILDGIRRNSVGPNAGKWAKVVDFDNPASGRDAAGRLGREHKAFEFTTRTFADGATTKLRIYGRYIGLSE